MARRRIDFEAWGIQPRRLNDALPAYAMADADATPLDAVSAAIERKTGLVVVNTRADGYRQSHGRPVSRHWEITLGRRLSGGNGYSVEGRLWVALPVPQRGAE